ncbi:hypothetical protein ES288_A05G371800v1 [Gossypium darwinii]|uniref:Uncharacterized protein n=1 Tax=Gossypium darwinii TaxID=34276 RepID=A0A5D2GQZ3_GOSDA|nr:hypothetical protein ES288_A05G371800v1 [Gossypium darwinii]
MQEVKKNYWAKSASSSGYHAQNDVEVSIKEKNDWEDVASEFQRRKSVGLFGGSDFRT